MGEAAQPGACRECGGPLETYQVSGIDLTPPLCPTCGTAAAEREEAERQARELERTLRLAGATTRLLHYTLGSHPDLAAVDVAEAWLRAYEDGARRNLWCHGPIGTGKTGLAWGVVRLLTERAIEEFYATPEDARDVEPRSPALFLIWADLLDELRASFAAERRAEQTGIDADPAVLFERARRIPVLALDDLGRERPTSWALERLASLVEYRYQRELPTVVTSNYGTRELAARLGREERVTGERIVSRLLEDAVGYLFRGNSRRRAAVVS